MSSTLAIRFGLNLKHSFLFCSEQSPSEEEERPSLVSIAGISLPQVLSAALGVASDEASGSGVRRVMHINGGTSEGGSSSSNGFPIVAIASNAGSGQMDGVEIASRLGLPSMSLSGGLGESRLLDNEAASSSMNQEVIRAENDTSDSKNGKQKGIESEDEKKLAEIYENFDFEAIWDKLSQVLTRLRGDPNAAQILLPLIEVSHDFY